MHSFAKMDERCEGDSRHGHGATASLQRYGVQAEARHDNPDLDQHEHRYLQGSGGLWDMTILLFGYSQEALMP